MKKVSRGIRVLGYSGIRVLGYWGIRVLGYWGIGIFLLIGIYSCEDVFEKNLDKRDLSVLSPPLDFQTSQNQITFWWEQIKGANHYNIQLVDSNFDYIKEIIVDTNVTGEKVTISIFRPGTYMWRMRAENNTSATPYIIGSLTIDSTDELTEVSILGLSPSNGLITSNIQQTFKWIPHFAVDQYRVEIAKPDFSNNGNIQEVYFTVLDSQQHTFSEDGRYEWRVRAENFNNGTMTDFSTRVITIDTKAPDAPTLSSPKNNDSISLPVTLAWSVDTSSVNDSLFIYNDSLQTLITKIEIENTSYSFPGNPNDSTFYWRVKSIDAAGNISNFSSSRKFFVK